MTDRIQEAMPGVGASPHNTNAQSRYAFPERNPYGALTGPPKLQFGEYGELTHKTIDQAGLSGDERKRAQEILKVQEAYLEIYQALDFPNDPDGHVVDLSGVHMTQPKVAIAWTLALLGFRSTGKKMIKKRFYNSGGIFENAYYYVNSHAPDDAALELRPEHRADDHHLPPDTRRLAAMRDGSPPQQLPDGFHAAPKIIYEDVPREKSLQEQIAEAAQQCVNPQTPQPADTMDAP
jgi:hypothetical protein